MTEQDTITYQKKGITKGDPSGEKLAKENLNAFEKALVFCFQKMLIRAEEIPKKIQIIPVEGLPRVIPVGEPCKAKPKAVAQPCFFIF